MLKISQKVMQRLDASTFEIYIQRLCSEIRATTLLISSPTPASGLDSGAIRERVLEYVADDAQEARLLATIERYRNRGGGGWGYLSPCSAFAADAWRSATGERLGHRSGIISNPSRLRRSIEAANAGDLNVASGADPKSMPARPPSSRRPVRSSVEPCSSG